MTDREPVPSDEELSVWLLACVDDWPLPDDLLDRFDETWVERTIDDIVAGRRPGRPRRGRWRRRVAVGAVVGALAVAGTAAAASVLRSGQPARPEVGASCRARGPEGDHIVAISAGIDPIEGCRQVWASGTFAGTVTSDTIPDLISCIGSDSGLIEVIPANETTCADLGWRPADAELDAESRLMIDLQTRLTDEINLLDCQPATAVAEQARAILDELGLTGWHIEHVAEPVTNTCAKASSDSFTTTININQI